MKFSQNKLKITISAMFKAVLLALSIGALPTMAAAQGQFSPAVYVNDGAITKYELQQRILLLKALRTSGDLEKEAIERLISERLQIQAALQAGIALSDADISAGVDEFASRTQQTGAQFLANIASQGVAPDSFRDFVKAGLAWRQLVRSKFSPNTNITDAEIDRAISLRATKGSAQVLISEIFLPTNTPENTEISLELAPQIARLSTVAEFSDAARRFSAGPSRQRGGVVPNWVPIDNLPPNVRAALLTMKPGQVTEPIEIPNALALFQLRALQETVAPALRNPTLDYAAYYIAGGQSAAGLERATELRGLVDRCDDLYGVAQGQPESVLDRDSLRLNEIPRDVALELAKLDVGEVSTSLTRANGETLVFLMLCGREADSQSEVSRDAVRQSLVSQRLAGLADAYLDELRANATIQNP
ncbi:MAG: peptidylprolyl isomerase [Paracoccaceae bacterium]